jgi:hypothetical protein
MYGSNNTDGGLRTVIQCIHDQVRHLRVAESARSSSSRVFRANGRVDENPKAGWKGMGLWARLLHLTPPGL